MGRHGGGGGGHGKDAASPPIDQYRKRIGRQNSNKERVHLKAVRKEHDAKEMAPKTLNQMFILLATILTVLSMVYAVLFFSIKK